MSELNYDVYNISTGENFGVKPTWHLQLRPHFVPTTTCYTLTHVPQKRDPQQRSSHTNRRDMRSIFPSRVNLTRNHQKEQRAQFTKQTFGNTEPSYHSTFSDQKKKEKPSRFELELLSRPAVRVSQRRDDVIASRESRVGIVVVAIIVAMRGAEGRGRGEVGHVDVIVHVMTWGRGYVTDEIVADRRPVVVGVEVGVRVVESQEVGKL